MDVAEAKELVKAEVVYHLGDSWNVSYFKAARIYGQCRHGPTKKLIRINELFLAQCEKQQVLELVRHEIAHGLAGNHRGHDKHFAGICNLLGTSPKSTMKICLDVPYKFSLTCSHCGHVYKRHTYRRTWRCGLCKNKLVVERLR
jgi:predicted SprT family Zn-dependent metalloprotease